MDLAVSRAASIPAGLLLSELPLRCDSPAFLPLHSTSAIRANQRFSQKAADRGEGAERVVWGEVPRLDSTWSTWSSFLPARLRSRLPPATATLYRTAARCKGQARARTRTRWAIIRLRCTPASERCCRRCPTLLRLSARAESAAPGDGLWEGGAGLAPEGEATEGKGREAQEGKPRGPEQQRGREGRGGERRGGWMLLHRVAPSCGSPVGVGLVMMVEAA